MSLIGSKCCQFYRNLPVNYGKLRVNYEAILRVNYSSFTTSISHQIWRKILTQDGKAVQKDLDKLAAWGKTWTMEFHPDKCEAIRITRSVTQHNILVLNGHQLKHVDVVKYLGVQISRDLRWDKHIDYITAKANYTLLALYAVKSISAIHRSISTAIKPTYVQFFFEYSQPVWCYYYHQEEEDPL